LAVPLVFEELLFLRVAREPPPCVIASVWGAGRTGGLVLLAQMGVLWGGICSSWLRVCTAPALCRC
jgi:hypothetical protein